MATITRDLLNRAFRLIAVCDPDETPTARQCSDALAALNQMMHNWRSQSVDIAHSDLTLDDDVNLDDQYIEACTALLAVRLQPEYPGSVLTPSLIEIANNGWSALQAGFLDIDNLRVDRGLSRIGRRHIDRRRVFC